MMEIQCINCIFLMFLRVTNSICRLNEVATMRMPKRASDNHDRFSVSIPEWFGVNKKLTPIPPNIRETKMLKLVSEDAFMWLEDSIRGCFFLPRRKLLCLKKGVDKFQFIEIDLQKNAILSVPPFFTQHCFCYNPKANWCFWGWCRL